ncbi:MAG: helix-turn-helix transcriptional regulator, partial [Pseudonocardia sp.]|nr:helix-turn-helix transcriptional regulator [Pseudonocardia sp.]
GPADDLPLQWIADMALTARGRLRLARGDAEGALADLTESGRRLAAIGCVNPAMSDWRSGAALALHHLGRSEEAVRLAEDEVVLARSWGTPRVLAVAMRRRGRVRGGTAGLSDAQAAIEILGDGFPLERARALHVCGTLHRAAHDAAAARAALGAAHDVAQGCGATRLLCLVRDELLVVGGRPRVVRGSPRIVLTGGEEPVARMAARGVSNAQIAAELFLARRTVEAHLTSVYRKLDIRGRSQLPDALDRLDGQGSHAG